MAYFAELPNISYISRLANSSRNDERILVKNLFKRAKIRSDIDSIFTAFTYYQIQEAERPDILAKKIYDDPELDWIILLTNNITNIRHQWPLNNNDLNNYIMDKYSNQASTIHHYETNELRDSSSRLLLKKGLEVGSDFTFTYTYKLGDTWQEKTIQSEKAVAPVSNYEYEQRLNEEKRRIKLLKKEYISVVITDMRNMMRYNKSSSDYISKDIKTTYNPRIYGV
tara:strand:- start:1014 stop:1688 length:675 start_codon:yes stop_codon:yes gene_type:complete